MRPSSVSNALRTCVLADQPVMLHGSPGGGKSQIVKQLADELGYDFRDVRLSQLDPVDLRGVPSVDRDKKLTTWNPPDFLPHPGTPGYNPKGILFLDEINSAPQGTAAAAYQLVLDRRLGDYILPEGWRIVAAGNKSSDRALVNEMSTALKNRFTHIDYETNLEDWVTWAFQNNIEDTVIGFIRFRPHLLNEFEQRSNNKEEIERLKRMRDSKAFGTPRSWEFVSKIMQAKPSRDIEFELIQGIVGEGSAVEYMAYIKYYRDLPSLDEILMNPKKAPIPKEQPATMWAVCTGLASRANKDNFENVMTYTERLPKEYQVLVVKDSIIKDKDIRATRTLARWCNDNVNVVL
jgi:MoxR-like ATPase